MLVGSLVGSDNYTMCTVHVIVGTRRYEIHIQGTRVSSYDCIAEPLQFTHDQATVTRCSDMTWYK